MLPFVAGDIVQIMGIGVDEESLLVGEGRVTTLPGGTLHGVVIVEGTMSLAMPHGCKVYMTSNESCFMVTWIVFKYHLLEVRLTQNRKTMALRMLTIVDLFYSNMCRDPHE